MRITSLLRLAVVAAATAFSGAALAQSNCPQIIDRAVLTAGQWQNCFNRKQDALGYPAVNKNGDVMLGEIKLFASSTDAAGLNLGTGFAPTAPANGDVWLTTVGVFARVNGSTVGPLTGTGANTFTGMQTIDLGTGTLPAAQTGSGLRVGGANATAARVEIDAFGSQGFFSTVCANGTRASPTTLTAGTQCGGYNMHGWNGTANVGPAASFRTYAAETWTGSAFGSYAEIATTANTTTTLTSRLRVENDGGVMVPPAVTGGSKGAGTINATDLYRNNVQVVDLSSSQNLSGKFIDNSILGGSTPGPGTFTTLAGQQTFALSGRVDATIAADQNNWTPSGSGTYSQAHDVFVDGGVADRNITGLTGGAAGRHIRIVNKGTTNSIILSNQSGSSTAANRFLLPADTILAVNTALELVYDGTASVWRPESRALANTGVTAGSYGSGTQVPTFTVDAQGRITTAANTAVTATAASMTVGTTTVLSGTGGNILYNNAGVLGNVGTTGTGSVVLAAGPALTGTTTATALTVSGTSALSLSTLTTAAGNGYLCWNNPIVTFATTSCGPSDQRLKTNITSFADGAGLSTVMALRPVSYDLIEAANNPGRQIGLLAQDVQAVMPELVSDNGDRTIKKVDGTTETLHDVLSLDYARLTIPLIRAVQELKAQNDALVARVQALEARP